MDPVTLVTYVGQMFLVGFMLMVIVHTIREHRAARRLAAAPKKPELPAAPTTDDALDRLAAEFSLTPAEVADLAARREGARVAPEVVREKDARIAALTAENKRLKQRPTNDPRAELAALAQKTDDIYTYLAIQTDGLANHLANHLAQQPPPPPALPAHIIDPDVFGNPASVASRRVTRRPDQPIHPRGWWDNQLKLAAEQFGITHYRVEYVLDHQGHIADATLYPALSTDRIERWDGTTSRTVSHYATGGITTTRRTT